MVRRMALVCVVRAREGQWTGTRWCGRRWPQTGGPGAMAWNPANDEKFKAERFPPFEGLASLVRVRPGLAFERQAIEQVSGRWDLVFSNAAIQ
jgi:hypothetical protein